MKIFLFIQKICTSFHYDIFITLFFPTNNIIVVEKEYFYPKERGLLVKIVQRQFYWNESGPKSPYVIKVYTTRVTQFQTDLNFLKPSPFNKFFILKLLKQM